MFYRLLENDMETWSNAFTVYYIIIDKVLRPQLFWSLFSKMEYTLASSIASVLFFSCLLLLFPRWISAASSIGCMFNYFEMKLLRVVILFC